MKIEKINDNKIRCTLTSADLAERNLKLRLTARKRPAACFRI